MGARICTSKRTAERTKEIPRPVARHTSREAERDVNPVRLPPRLNNEVPDDLTIPDTSQQPSATGVVRPSPPTKTAKLSITSVSDVDVSRDLSTIDMKEDGEAKTEEKPRARGGRKSSAQGSKPTLQQLLDKVDESEKNGLCKAAEEMFNRLDKD